MRHDSGLVREFSPIEKSVHENSVFRALVGFKNFIVAGTVPQQRPYQDYESELWITTAFHLRTITTPEELGEPALEGVHSDGVDHTMTVLLTTDNMSADSAQTRLHDNAQKNAITWEENDPKFIVTTVQHTHPLDTLIVFDHELKHSVSSVWATDPSRDATRDMLILFTRKPALEGHASWGLDSIQRDADLSDEISYAPVGD
ncbi:hypothetical protein GCM10022402_39530 [Salinactinospora qingdaonensis]|uniref:2OG-Fe dioxygenase n=1 Tax=Salinactinospora qingdaonensis TaxID=702744 RepID=A0ABP7G626_9ACTN